MLMETVEKAIKEAVVSGRAFIRVQNIEFGLDGGARVHADIKFAAAQTGPISVSIAPPGDNSGINISDLKDAARTVLTKIAKHPKLKAKRKYTRRATIPATVAEFKRKGRPKKEMDPADKEEAFDRLCVTRTFDLQDEDTRLMRMHLIGWKTAGKLSKDEKARLDEFSSVWIQKMPEDARGKMRDLFNDVRKRLGLIK
jgi:hypothetical protein